MALKLLKEEKRTQSQHYEEHVRNMRQNVATEKMDPLNSALGKVRVDRTLLLLKDVPSLQGNSLLDLGCGSGYLAFLMAEKGAHVTAVDVVNKICHFHDHVTFQQACIPYLKLPDAAFDGVLLTDVLAEIEPSLYRLTLSELARLVKPAGWVLFSTPLDLASLDAKEKFLQLIATEFDICGISESYHRLYFFLLNLLKAPFRFVRASREAAYRLRHLTKRSGIFRIGFYFNSSRSCSWFWKPLLLLFLPLLNRLQQSRGLLLFLERLSEIVCGSTALTHLIVLAQKKKL